MREPYTVERATGLDSTFFMRGKQVHKRKLMTHATNFCPKLVMVVPCYNEEQVLPITNQLFLNKLLELIDAKKISEDSRILFVNDGSKDSTWQIICDLANQDKHFMGISQSRNRGHQNAVLAGLMEVKDSCDITISMDCDGQNDVGAIDDMLEQYQNGYSVVCGVRKDRNTDGFFKKWTATIYYKLLRSMGAELIKNHADYRLIDSRVLQELAKFEEVNLFLRGLIPLVGFKQTWVYYQCNERMAGETHYTLSKMLTLAFDGITSLTIKPIRMITILGLLIALGSLVGILYAILMVILGHTVSGWASLICVICFFGGVQLLAIGILGEYIGKTYLETKHRPRYIISDRTNNF